MAHAAETVPNHFRPSRIIVVVETRGQTEAELDEREAIRRLGNGDVSALEPLVRAYQLRAVRAAYLITRDRRLAEELVQDAFIRSYERIGQLRPGNPYGPWFLRIVANDALKAATRGGRWTSFPLSTDGLEASAVVPDPEPGPEAVTLENETREEVWAALADLSPDERALLVLRYYLEWRETELAEWLGTPLGTVKWRLHEARRHLRDILQARAIGATRYVHTRSQQ
jgi:RNA polymerase sigma-70 factor, ECF subfamily